MGLVSYIGENEYERFGSEINKNFDGFYAVDSSESDGKLRPEKCLGFIQNGKTLLKAFDYTEVLYYSSKVKFKYMPSKMYFYTFKNSNSELETECYVYEEDGKLYQYFKNWASGGGFYIGDQPTCLYYIPPDDEMCLMISGGEHSYKYICSSGKYYTVAEIPKCRYSLIRRERMFLVDYEEDNRIVFSAPMEIQDWTERFQMAGYVDIPSETGKIIGLVDFCDAVCIIRKKGITVLHCYADVMNFSVSEIYSDFGEILENTFAVVGEYLVFATEAGIARFDGSKIERVSDDLGFRIKNTQFGAPCAFGGKFFIGAEDKDGELISVCVDPESGDYALLPFHGICFGTDGKDLYFVGDNLYLYRIIDIGESGKCTCVWEKRDTDFKLGLGNKVIKEIYLHAKGTYTLTLSSENKEYVFSGEDSALIRPRIKGQVFTLKIEGNIDELNSMEVKAVVY